jgi:hypothetical protein
MSPILAFIIQSFIKHFHDLDEVIPVNNSASALLVSHDCQASCLTITH